MDPVAGAAEVLADLMGWEGKPQNFAAPGEGRPGWGAVDSGPERMQMDPVAGEELAVD